MSQCAFFGVSLPKVEGKNPNGDPRPKALTLVTYINRPEPYFAYLSTSVPYFTEPVAQVWRPDTGNFKNLEVIKEIYLSGFGG